MALVDGGFLNFRDPWGNRVEIVGYDNISGGNSFNAYLLSPVPEPTSLGLLAMAGGALLSRRQRKHNRT